MGEHTTWFDLLPGFDNLQAFFRQYLGRSWSNDYLPPQEHFSLVPVITLLVLMFFLLMVGIRFRRQSLRDDALVPPSNVTFFSLFDLFFSAIYDMVLSVMESKEHARKIFPLASGLFLIILLANLVGIIPGMDPPTAHLQFNLVLALLVFIFTHYLGIREHGLGYIKQFTGEFLVLAPLMIILETISHIARPLSLTIRLLGNMFADHKVVAIFTFMIPLVIPLPFLFLGVLVSLVQAFVFTLLAVVYFSMALAAEH
ncbi:F0F1 ATP synthase subunit A [Myxococcota bacterium]|nr:F0F1 ATP synthase subunit A [Myxococcota bacterium]MBU1534820.1 F0F1 ATP synthase subunit A [Myxococcota bacterium]